MPAGTGGPEDPFDVYGPLGSFAMQALTSDLNQLAIESPYRPLVAVPGFSEVQTASPTGASTPAGPDDFDWFGRYTASPSLAVACLGSHLVYRTATDSPPWPDLVLRARVEPPSAPYVMGVCLVAAPGMNANAAAVTDPALYALDTVSGSAWADLELRISLTPATLGSVALRPRPGAAPTGVGAADAPVTGFALTAWLSAYATGGKGQIVAVTLSLEPPP